MRGRKQISSGAVPAIWNLSFFFRNVREREEGRRGEPAKGEVEVALYAYTHTDKY